MVIAIPAKNQRSTKPFAVPVTADTTWWPSVVKVRRKEIIKKKRE